MRPHSAQFWCNLSPLDATLLSSLLCVANKELAQYLSLLDATFTKNIGGWAGRRHSRALSSIPTSLPRYLVTSLLPLTLFGGPHSGVD